MKRQAGFTLIELMIAIAILGILMTIAVPAYMDYAVRSRVSEGLMAAGPAQSAVTEFILSQLRLPGSQQEAGFNTVKTKYVAGIRWTNNRILVDIDRSAVGASCDPDFYLVPQPKNSGGDILGGSGPWSNVASVDWNCVPRQNNANCTKYLPAECRS